MGILAGCATNAILKENFIQKIVVVVVVLFFYFYFVCLFVCFVYLKYIRFILVKNKFCHFFRHSDVIRKLMVFIFGPVAKFRCTA